MMIEDEKPPIYQDSLESRDRRTVIMTQPEDDEKFHQGFTLIRNQSGTIVSTSNEELDSLMSKEYPRK